MKRLLSLLGLGTLIAVLGVFAAVALAGDKPDDPPEPPGNHVPVTICHATNSETNPYVIISPDADSVVKAGHGDHTGPIFQPGMKADKVRWGDVIPSFTWYELVNDHGTKSWVAHQFPGLNGGDVSVCITEQPPGKTDVTPTAPTFRDPTCDVGAAVNLPTVTGVSYTLKGTVAAGHKVTVEATADEGYVLVGTAEWEHTFGQVPDNCTTPPPPAIEVTPGVTFQDPTCDVGAAVTPTTTTGLTYTIDGKVAPGEKVSVTASANDGYTIVGNATWEHTFGQVPDNCAAPPETTPTTPTTPTAPLTPPTTKPVATKPAVKKPAAKPAPAPPKQAVAGTQAEKQPTLAYTP